MQRVLRGNNWRHFDVVDSYGISTTSLQRLILPLLLSWLNILDLSARQEIECLSPGANIAFFDAGSALLNSLPIASLIHVTLKWISEIRLLIVRASLWFWINTPHLPVVLILPSFLHTIHCNAKHYYHNFHLPSVPSLPFITTTTIIVYWPLSPSHSQTLLTTKCWINTLLGLGVLLYDSSCHPCWHGNSLHSGLLSRAQGSMNWHIGNVSEQSFNHHHHHYYSLKPGHTKYSAKIDPAFLVYIDKSKIWIVPKKLGMVCPHILLLTPEQNPDEYPIMIDGREQCWWRFKCQRMVNTSSLFSLLSSSFFLTQSP